MFSKKPFFAHAVPYIMPSLDNAGAMVFEEGENETTANDVFKIQRVEEIEREAYERGFDAGQKAGFEMGEQKALLLIQRLEKAVSDITELHQKELKELEKQVLELSIAIAKKIVLKELTLNPDIMADIVREALMRLQRTGQITIRIHPSLNEIFLRNKPELLSISPDIVFELDTKSPLYGAEIIGPEESIKTDIEEQFRNILDDMGVRLARD